jgi:hypothetical protein
VEVTSGHDAGRATTTTSGGAFTLDVAAGDLTLRVSNPGYDSMDRALSVSQDLWYLAFPLKPSAGCLLSVTPDIFTFLPPSGATASLTVVPVPARTWMTASNDSWIEVTSGATGTGPGTVAFRVLPNQVTSGDVRRGSIRISCNAIEGQTAWISQRPTCQPGVAWASDSPTSFSAGGGAGHLWVLAEPSCAWQAVSQSDWITLGPHTEGSSDGDVHFTVAPNPTGTDRTGTIVIAEKPWAVIQKGQ